MNKKDRVSEAKLRISVLLRCVSSSNTDGCVEESSSGDGCCSEVSSASLSELVSADSTCTSGMKALLSFFLQESQIHALIEI